jgi:hypothetical protein
LECTLSLNLDPASTLQFSCGGAEKLAGSVFLNQQSWLQNTGKSGFLVNLKVTCRIHVKALKTNAATLL